MLLGSTDSFDFVSPLTTWAEANRQLASGGQLTYASQLLESFLQRATQADYQELQVTDVEAWTLLGRTHAMNEKEERALSAFREARRALGEEDAMREKVAGEMFTVRSRSFVTTQLRIRRTSPYHSSTSRATSQL